LKFRLVVLWTHVYDWVKWMEHDQQRPLDC
jgi:hypothetical protein